MFDVASDTKPRCVAVPSPCPTTKKNGDRIAPVAVKLSGEVIPVLKHYLSNYGIIQVKT